jgi:hypothetical protein
MGKLRGVRCRRQLCFLPVSHTVCDTVYILPVLQTWYGKPGLLPVVASEHTSADVSIRQQTSAYVSRPEDSLLAVVGLDALHALDLSRA